MSTTLATGAPASARLAYFPISFFATVMGLAGLTLATLRLEHHLGVAPLASPLLLALAASAFVAIAGLYGVKIVRHPGAVRDEWHHPIKIAFFPTISISLILLATALQPFLPGAAIVVWSAGATLHLVATWAIVSMWITGAQYEAPHMNPAWFIPAVGNVLVPLVGAQHGLVEVSWFFLAVGIVFWLVLLTLVFNRLVFHQPLPAHLLPTLCILIAPPAVAFLAYVSLTGMVDGAARLLYYPALFFFLLVVGQLPTLMRLAFALSWWAYSFPLAALTVATFVMAERTGNAVLEAAAFGFYVLLLLVVGGLAVRTVRAIRAGAICQPHP